MGCRWCKAPDSIVPRYHDGSCLARQAVDRNERGEIGVLARLIITGALPPKPEVR